MKVFSNLKFRTKLLLIVLLPLMGFMYFSIDSLVEKSVITNEMEKLETLAELSVKLGSLAHEFQKERGMTAGFLGSNGGRFARELSEQRKESDRKIAELKLKMNDLSMDHLGGNIRSLALGAVKSMDELDAKRKAITALSVEPRDAFAFYSNIITKMLSVPNEAATLSSDAEVSRNYSAYAALLMAKEHAGKERAALTAAFAADRFTPKAFSDFLSERAAQTANIDAFENFALDEQQAFYRNKVSGKAVAEVARLEEIAIDKMNDNSLGVDSQHWFNVMTEKINLLKDVEDKLAGDLIKTSRERRDRAHAFMYFFAVISVTGLLVTSLFALLMIRSLLAQIGGEPDYAASIVKRIATGDLTAEVETRDEDQSSLLFAMRRMSESLREMVNGVRGSTDTITAAALEIARDNAGLSQRTEEQATSLEETASSMEELTTTVRQNAESAKHANQMAASAADIALKGGRVVGHVVGTMSSISESSKRIVDIISVIDGIAFQTNILALNAAVEAARAGEQGRGFAVVAGEVRSLAQRSAAAAKEIKELINDSVSKVDVGSRQVDEAGETMAEIVRAVKRVTDIMAEIAAASNEQSAGIEQINQAIIQMDGITQQNAALVEEAAASAESLEQQAIGLREAMSAFKVRAASQGLHILAKPLMAERAHEATGSGSVHKLAVAAGHEAYQWQSA